MTTTTEVVHAAEVSGMIRRQLPWDVLATLGASELMPTIKDRGGLTFVARILPFTKTGRRGTAARRMRVDITLNGRDYYDVHVYYVRKFEVVTHYEADDVDVETLPALLRALDFDGPEVLNPQREKK